MRNFVQVAFLGLLSLSLGPELGFTQLNDDSQSELPFQCDTEQLDPYFVVKEPSYNKKTAQLVWTLQARKNVRLPRFQAFITDPDGVEVDTIRLLVTPNVPRLEAGKSIRLTLSLKHVDLERVRLITIRW
jgi:hypothetical protein